MAVPSAVASSAPDSDAPAPGAIDAIFDATATGDPITAAQARTIARRDRDFRREVRARGADPDTATLTTYLDEDRGEWRVDLPDPDSDGELVRAEISRHNGLVRGVWTGHQIRWRMARGDRGAFGGATNDPWLWWSFSAAFVLLLFHPGRIRSRHTLDLLALVALGASHEFFREGMLEWSVPLAVPPLAWLMVRFAWLSASLSGGWLRAMPPSRWPPTWLALALAVLAAGVRYGLHWEESSVIDVGYAGVIGAERILDGSTPYGTMPSDNEHGDTYGPLNYLLYVPAVLAWPWSGGWDDLQAAHAVAIGADVACAILLGWLAWRWVSARAGAIALAAWMLCPYTLYPMNSSSNDALVALFVLAAVAATRKPPAAGAFVGAAAMVKFLPAVAVGLVASGSAAVARRRQAAVAIGAALVVVASLGYVATLPGGVRAFLDATFGFQLGRPSPFSIWGLWNLGTAKRIGQVAVLLAALVLLVRRSRRTPLGAAAAATSMLIAAQLVLEHWFYLYVVWFVPTYLLVLVALREGDAGDAPVNHGDRHDPDDGRDGLVDEPVS